MAETSDRVQDALAAYLDHLEMGGPQPDTSHLSSSEQTQLEELIAALDLTEGIPFGLGRSEEREAGKPSPPPREANLVPPGLSEQVRSELKTALPPDVRIAPDTNPHTSQIGGIAVAEGWIVGTFGGRIRVWLLAVETAQEIETNRDCLSDLNRVFGALPDTTAVVLVAQDLAALIVHPEDCAPQINIPTGSLIGRRYKQPVQPLAEGISGLLNELIPYWDPIPAFEADPAQTFDTSEITKKSVTTAVDEQRGIGVRARKGNPKKDALLELGDSETTALTKLADGLLDGSVTADEIEQQIERLAKDQ